MNDRDPDCLFCRIAAGEIPSQQVHADDEIVAFRDINPQAPTHVLVVPRRHIEDVRALTDADADLVADLFAVLRGIADREGLDDGYRIVTNIGPAAGQSVPHLHFHLLGGRSMGWPPG